MSPIIPAIIGAGMIKVLIIILGLLIAPEFQTMPLKRPMAAACIAGGVTGAFVGFVRLTSHAFATPALVSLPQFISPDKPNNMLYAIVAAVTDISSMTEQPDESQVAGNTVYAPIAGRTVPLSQVDDPAFSMEILGKGLAVLPADGRVFAPFDGEVVSIFETKHALGLKSDSGMAD